MKTPFEINQRQRLADLKSQWLMVSQTNKQPGLENTLTIHRMRIE